MRATRRWNPYQRRLELTAAEVSANIFMDGKAHVCSDCGTRSACKTFGQGVCICGHVCDRCKPDNE